MAEQAQAPGFGSILDMVLRLLSILVIPLILWGVRLEVNNALQDERIAEMQADLLRLANIQNQVQQITVAMVRLEEKMTNVDDKLRDVAQKFMRAGN